MRIYKFDTIKAIAMVNVILVHAYVSTIPGPRIFKDMFVSGVLGASMFLFSVISGWMMRPGRWNWYRTLRLLLIAVVANYVINFVEMRSGYEPSHGYRCVADSIWYLAVLIACKMLLPAFSRPSWALCFAILISWTSFLLPARLNFHPLHRFFGFVPFRHFRHLGQWPQNNTYRPW